MSMGGEEKGGIFSAGQYRSTEKYYEQVFENIYSRI